MIKIENLKESEYKETLGVMKKTFDSMLEQLKRVYASERSKGGRLNYKLTLTDKLVIMLIYIREYRTMHSIAVDYGVCKNEIWKAIHWVENVLIAADFLHIEGKKALLKPNAPIDVILIDVTECDIERPKRNQKAYYSGKKTTYDKGPDNC